MKIHFLLVPLKLSQVAAFHTTNINTAIVFLNPNDLLGVIFYGDKSFNKETYCKKLTMKFIKDL